MEFYRCNHCGNIIEYVKSSGVPVMCCGEKMQKMVPGSTDAATEKHVPVVNVEGNKVKVVVGSVAHPMIQEHYIQWIVIETTNGSQRVHLRPGEAPVAEFVLAENEKFVNCYEYCNLHGLWEGK